MCNHGQNTSTVNSILLLFKEIVILNIYICVRMSCTSIFCKVHSLPTQSHLLSLYVFVYYYLAPISLLDLLSTSVGKVNNTPPHLCWAVLRKQAGNFPNISRKWPCAILAKPLLQYQVHLVSPLPCTMPDQTTAVMLKQSFDELTL